MEQKAADELDCIEFHDAAAAVVAAGAGSNLQRLLIEA
jgi:hypothetical protein